MQNFQNDEGELRVSTFLDDVVVAEQSNGDMIVTINGEETPFEKQSDGFWQSGEGELRAFTDLAGLPDTPQMLFATYRSFAEGGITDGFFDGEDGLIVLGVIGDETEADALSGLNARYLGRYEGIRSDDTVADGSVDLLANFATGAIEGEFASSGGAIVDLENGAITGSSMTGSMSSVDIPSLSGTVEGQFYGDTGDQLGGVFEAIDIFGEGAGRAVGHFGAVRQ